MKNPVHHLAVVEELPMPSKDDEGLLVGQRE